MAGMEEVPKEILRAAYERRPIHLLKIPLLFAVWGAAVVGVSATQTMPLGIVVGLAASVLIAYVIRGLGAVAHDAVHGNCARSKVATYLISLICWAPTGMAVTLYANYHLHHHKITNSYPDVDNVVVTDYTTHPVLAKVFLLCVYTFAYPMYWLSNMGRYYRRLTVAQRVIANVEALGFWSLVALAFVKLPGHVFFFGFALPFTFGSMLASMTSMIEHFEMPQSDDDAYSSRTYGTKAMVTNFLWNNVTFHNEHHRFPGIPYYNLRSFHEAAYPHYDARVKAACFPSIYPLAFKLYRQILDLDVSKIEARYSRLDKQAERDKCQSLPGIAPGSA